MCTHPDSDAEHLGFDCRLSSCVYMQVHACFRFNARTLDLGCVLGVQPNAYSPASNALACMSCAVGSPVGYSRSAKYNMLHIATPCAPPAAFEVFAQCARFTSPGRQWETGYYFLRPVGPVIRKSALGRCRRHDLCIMCVASWQTPTEERVGNAPAADAKFN